jgi:Ca-activated chloride channel family protein
MTRLFTCGVLAACVLGAVTLRQAQGQTQPSFRGGSDIVRVFATVTDHDGKLVPNLARDVFEVRDEGKPQPLTLFDNSPQPIRLIVMLDVSGSMEGNLSLLRAAGAQLFSRLRADDVARVGAFGHEVTISPSFTHDADVLRAALPTSIAPDAPTPLWRALDQAIGAFGNEDDRRKVVLVLSDGKDSGATTFSLRQQPTSQAEVIDRARAEDVMVYAVGMRSRSSQPMMPSAGPGGLRGMMLADMPDPGLARVAEETGGGYTEIRAGQDLAAAFAAVADELHAQYLLGFATPAHDGKVHALNVRVSKPGLKARARKSYVAPKG